MRVTEGTTQTQGLKHRLTDRQTHIGRKRERERERETERERERERERGGRRGLKRR